MSVCSTDHATLVSLSTDGQRCTHEDLAEFNDFIFADTALLRQPSCLARKIEYDDVRADL